jgi:hypothetical protein
MIRDELLRDIADRFQREASEHQMTVLLDQGLYRHLRFKRADTGFYWFELVTIPNALIFRGDGESFMFSRTEDMFTFFRGRPGWINPTYWAEKVTSNRDCLMRYSEDEAKRMIREYYRDLVADGAPQPLARERFAELLNAEELGWGEHDARYRIARFKFDWTEPAEHGEPKRVAYRLDSAWEWNLREYDWWFLWACHAIVWGIARYDAAKAVAV